MGESLGEAVLDLTVDKGRFDSDVDRAKRKTKEWEQAAAKAEKQWKALGKSLQDSGRQLSNVGSSLTRSVTLPIVAIGGLAIKTFADFDSSMNKSLAIMGDVSDSLKNEMAVAAREMAKTTVFSAKQAAESYFFLASAGLDAESSIAVLPTVAAFAQAGMFDMAIATDLLTDAQSALGLAIRDDAVANMQNMVRVSDVLVKANTIANATVQEFSEALTSEAGAALKSFGKDVEEGVAVLAAFADQGVKGQVAGTGLSRILRLMSSAAISNKDAYDELGISVFDANDKMRNIADIVEDLEGALGGMSDKTRTASLEQLGFAARVQGVILPLLGSSEAIRQYEADLRSAGGTTQEVADNQLESFSAKMGLLKDGLFDAAITLGGVLADSLLAAMPLFNGIISAVTALAEGFAALPFPVQAIAVALAAIAAAAGPVLLVLGGLLSAAGAIAAALAPGAALAVGGAATITMIKAIGASLLGPVGLVIALAAAALAITSFVSKEGGLLENWAAGAVGSFEEIRGSLTDNIPAVNELADSFRESFPAITAEISKGIAAGESYEDILKALFKEFAEGTSEGDALREKLGEMAEAELAAAAAAEDKLAPAIDEVADAAGLAAAEIDELEQLISKLGFVTAANAKAEVLELVKAFETGLVPTSQMVDKVDELVEKYGDLGLLGPDVREQLDLIAQALTDQGAELDTNTLAALGRYEEALERLQAERMKEWQEGWTSSLGDTEDAVNDLGGATTDFFSGLESEAPKVGGILDTFSDALTDGLDQLVGGLTAAVGSLFTGGIEGALSTITGALKSTLGAAFNAVIPGLGALAGPLIDALESLVRGLFKKANAADHLAEQFSIVLSEGMAKAIDDLAKNTGDISAAFRLLLSKVIEEATITTEAQLDEWVKRVHEILSSVDEGFISLGQAVSSMTDSMLALVPSFDAAGGSAMDFQSAMSDIITRLGDTEAASIALQPVIEALMASGVAGTHELIGWLESLGVTFDGLQAAVEDNKSAWRLWAEEAGVSFEEFKAKSEQELWDLVKAMGLSGAQATRVFEAMLAKQAADQRAFNKTQRDLFRAQADDLGLSEKDKAAWVKGQMKLRRQEIRAAFVAARQIMIAERKAFRDNQRKMAEAAERAGARAARAWSNAANTTITSWEEARRQTVGGSSILDIERRGSEAAAQLGESHQQAAVGTGQIWQQEGRGVERLMRSLGANRLQSTSSSESRFTQAAGGGLGGGGSIVLNLELDGETITRKVVKLTPEILRKLGLA